MKINNSVRALYQELLELHKRLQARVIELFEAKKHRQWFFLYRLKEEESFALKLETGRVPSPREMEDFFACTLVVENRMAIDEAISLVNELCEVIDRRPPADRTTTKAPHEFSFDDLRLYVRLRSDDTLPSTPLNELVFEVQIKTFLQHAWGIATHDLVYKGQTADWARARVAYQIKAMLEHAELSVERVDAIASSSLIALTDEKMRTLRQVIEWLRSTWEEDLLPKDLVRLAENIISITRAVKVDLTRVFDLVREDTEKGQGASLQDLTPYAVVLRALYLHHSREVESYLRTERGRFRIFFANDPQLAQRVTALSGVRREKYMVLEDALRQSHRDDLS